MRNFICYRCGINKTFKEYQGQELLSDEGDLPCFECYLEWVDAKEEQDEDSECS